MQDGTALSLDLLGGCFSDQLRPPTLMPHHLTQHLHQGSSSAALRAVDSSPGLSQGQGLPAAALGTETSMASEVAVIAGSEKGSGREAALGAAGGSLRPGASTVEQLSHDSLMAFSGERNHFLLQLPPPLLPITKEQCLDI